MEKIGHRNMSVDHRLVDIVPVVAAVISVSSKSLVLSFQIDVVNLVYFNQRTPLLPREQTIQYFLNRSAACLTVVKKENLFHCLIAPEARPYLSPFGSRIFYNRLYNSYKH